MSLTDDTVHYGTVSRLLHWVMAALLIWQGTGMVVKNTMDRENPLVGFWVGTHASVGSVIFLLILIRFAWAFAQRGKRPAYAEGTIGRLAAAAHKLMYVLMLVVPTLGLLRLFGRDRAGSLFGVEVHPAMEREIAWMTAPADAVHGLLAWTLITLIVGHVAMVALHRWYWRDDTLARMAGRRDSRLGA